MKVLSSVTGLFVLCVIFNSCSQLLPPSLETTWHVVKLEPAFTDEESETIYNDAFISFYSNGLASFMNKGKANGAGGKPVYRVGTWNNDRDLLELNLNQTSIQVTFRILESTDKWLVIEITQGPKETIGTILKCQPSGLYRSNSFDLLHPANNAWRLRPGKTETPKQIKARVLSHVDFLIAYFAMVEEKSQGYFETAVLQTPFQFYSNGMALPEYFYDDQIWLANFYDEAEARQGAKILTQALASIEKYPADSKTYTKGYYNTLLLVKEFIEK